MIERPLVFEIAGESLLGILHDGTGGQREFGILIVVGGPQYRVGSHRQFVLTARVWAAAGFPVMRFDYRGMGDSTGEPRTFEAVHDDIGAAIDAMFRECPSLDRVVLFGLCDAASAILMYCKSDARVAGLIIANPWVRTPEGQARSYVRHYYRARLLQRSFWRKLLSGHLDAVMSLRGLLASWSRSRDVRSEGAGGFISRMRDGLATFPGPVLLLLSERDLTAKEFVDLCQEDPDWAKAAGRHLLTKVVVPKADHTFSTRAELERAAELSVAWLNSVLRQQ